MMSNLYGAVWCGVSSPPTRRRWRCRGALKRAARPFGMQHVAPRTLWDTPSQFNHACNKSNQWKTIRRVTLQMWWWGGGHTPEQQESNLKAAQGGMTWMDNRLPWGGDATMSASLKKTRLDICGLGPGGAGAMNTIPKVVQRQHVMASSPSS